MLTITNHNYDDLHFASCVLEKSGVRWIRDRKQSCCKLGCWLWEPKYLNFHHNISFFPRTDNVPCQAFVNTLSCQLSNNSRSKHHQCSDALGKQAKRLKHNWQPGISIFGLKKILPICFSSHFLSMPSKLMGGASVVEFKKVTAGPPTIIEKYKSTQMQKY